MLLWHLGMPCMQVVFAVSYHLDDPEERGTSETCALRCSKQKQWSLPFLDLCHITWFVNGYQMTFPALMMLIIYQSMHCLVLEIYSLTNWINVSIGYILKRLAMQPVAWWCLTETMEYVTVVSAASRRGFVYKTKWHKHFLAKFQ